MPLPSGLRYQSLFSNDVHLCARLLHRIIQACWEKSSIPTCWKRSLTVLIYKKGDTSDPSNFRPITLQPVFYKVLSSVIRNRIYAYLEENKFVNKRIQKGFWPTLDGVFEHTQMLTQLLYEAKCNQRSIIVTLLDLRNAFSEVNHKLINFNIMIPSPSNRNYQSLC